MAGSGEVDEAGSGFEDDLWNASDLLRGRVEPATYKHLVLSLLVLRVAGEAGLSVPPVADWKELRKRIGRSDLAESLDVALGMLEWANPVLAGAIPPVFAEEGLDPEVLGRLMALFDRVEPGHGTRDTLGRVYEYFLSRFARAEGRGGEYFTPACVVRLLVELVQPLSGTVYDPCCGTGGMFVQSLRFVEAHGGRPEGISVYGQESSRAIWRLARLNLALCGIRADLGRQPADTLHHDLHRGLKADSILANPPFNVSEWNGEALEGDPRWNFGVPPASNANFAWVQHMLHHLAPGGRAGFVLANGSLSTQRKGEGDIRRRLVEHDLVDSIVALPPQLFYATQIPACLWILARDRPPERRGSVFFVDGRALGRMESRTHRVLDDDDIALLASAYRAWCSDPGRDDEPGFCRSVPIGELRQHRFVLTPGRYVGSGNRSGDEEPAEEAVARLAAQVEAAIQEGRELDLQVFRVLEELGGER